MNCRKPWGARLNVLKLERTVKMHIESVMTPRLLAIAQSVPLGARLADVGTDHGYIPIYLCMQGKIKEALAMDLRQGPLSRAEENICRYGLEDQIKTRLSDGLQALAPGEADTAVIAGMGGLLIAEILEAAKFSLDCYILQPMTATAELRQYLAENGYKIFHEVLAKEEEKIYTIMSVRRGTMQVTDPVYYQVGQCLMESQDPLTPDLIALLLNKYQTALEGLLRSEREEARSKEQAYRALIDSLTGLQKECEAWSN